MQLKTATKIFCNCSTDFGAPPNANTCPVCLALPGALPVLNEHAVELAIRAALALGCEVQPTSVFARKNYFYPDLPKGYQISQFDRPSRRTGVCDRRRDDGERRSTIGITRAHLEEDAGKSVHDRFPSATAVDLNRAGVPLLEIVSEPDLRGAGGGGGVSANAQADSRIRRRQRREHGRGKPPRRRERQRAPARRDAPRDQDRGQEPEFVLGRRARARGGVCAPVRACSSAAASVEQQTMLWDETRGGGAAGAIEGRQPRLSLLPGARPAAARRRRASASSGFARALPELPDARRERYRASARGAHRLRHRRPDGERRARRLLRAVRRAKRRREDRRELAAWARCWRRSSRRGSGIADFSVRPDGSRDASHMVRDGVVSHSAAKQIFGIMVATGGAAEADRRARAAAQGDRRLGARRAGSTKCSPSIRRRPSDSSAASGGCRACSSDT